MAVEDFFFYLVFGLCKEVCFQTEGERVCVLCSYFYFNQQIRNTHTHSLSLLSHSISLSMLSWFHIILKEIRTPREKYLSQQSPFNPGRSHAAAVELLCSKWGQSLNFSKGFHLPRVVFFKLEEIAKCQLVSGNSQILGRDQDHAKLNQWD